MATLRFDRGTLLLEGVPIGGSDLLRGLAWRWDGRVNAWRTDAMNFHAIPQELSATDAAPQWEEIAFSRRPSSSLRPDQKRAAEEWSKRRRGILVMPTGTGKTEVALHLMYRLGLTTLVVAPIRDLMYQWQRRIRESLGFEAGIIGDARWEPASVTVTTYDSAAIHMERIGSRFGFIVFDECHHLAAPVFRDAARMSAATHRLGLTATLPGDVRRRILETLIGPVACRQTVPEVRGTILADYDIVRVPVHLSVDEQARYDELSRDIRRVVLTRRALNPRDSWKQLCADSATDEAARRAREAYEAKKAIENRATAKLRALEDIFRLHRDERVLVFTDSNAMARDVSRRFLIPLLLNETCRGERAEILDGFHAGTYRGIVANRVLDEGIDMPEVKIAAVLGGTSSIRQATQRLGRLLRRNGAQRATLYEVVCESTSEVGRSRARRRTDAYKRPRHPAFRPRKSRSRPAHPAA